MTKDSTPQKQFEQFLISKLSTFVQKCSEEEFGKMYELGVCLGDGATSSVRVAKRLKDGAEFAVKIINAKMLLSHRSLFREVAILSKLLVIQVLCEWLRLILPIPICIGMGLRQRRTIV